MDHVQSLWRFQNLVWNGLINVVWKLDENVNDCFKLLRKGICVMLSLVPAASAKTIKTSTHNTNARTHPGTRAHIRHTHMILVNRGHQKIGRVNEDIALKFIPGHFFSLHLERFANLKYIFTLVKLNWGYVVLMCSHRHRGCPHLVGPLPDPTQLG